MSRLLAPLRGLQLRPSALVYIHNKLLTISGYPIILIQQLEASFCDYFDILFTLCI